MKPTRIVLPMLLLLSACEDWPAAEATSAASESAETSAPEIASPDFCDAFDPVNRPADAVRIVHAVSADSGAPTGIIYGVWMTESGEVYGDIGRCNALEQYRIREKWLGANGRRQMEAVAEIARNSGWNHAAVNGSCGASTREAAKGNYGGCLGPMQVTPAEWVKNGRFGRKDPLKLCWAMLAAAHRLKADHDSRRSTGADDYAAWQWAIRRYAGGADHDSSIPYYRKIVRHWREWERLRSEGSAETALMRHADARGRKFRSGGR